MDGGPLSLWRSAEQICRLGDAGLTWRLVAWSECLIRPRRCPAGRTHHPRLVQTIVTSAALSSRTGVPERESLERLGGPCAASPLLLPQCPHVEEGAGGSLAALPSRKPLWRLAIGSAGQNHVLQLCAVGGEGYTGRERNLIRTRCRGQPGVGSPHPGTLQALFRQSDHLFRPAGATGLSFKPLTSIGSPSTP